MAKRIRLVYTAAALIPLSVLAAACGSSGSNSGASGSPSASAAAAMVGPALPTSPSKTPTTITETGSTLLYPLMGSWSEAYQKAFINSSNAPLVTIETGGTGSGTGITDAATGTVDIGASDAYLSTSDKQTYPTMLNIPLAISAQQINYNVPGVTKPLKLDGTVLAGIYTGKITSGTTRRSRRSTRASACRPSPIVPLHRADSSGDTFLFTSYLQRPGPECLVELECRHHASAGRRFPARSPRPATAEWCPAAERLRAASPTSASATCARTHGGGSGRGGAGERCRPVRGADLRRRSRLRPPL